MRLWSVSKTLCIGILMNSVLAAKPQECLVGGLCVLTEEMLLNTSTDDLQEFFDECSMIVLGGLGFCGLNPRYNADTGLFRDRVSREEDIERSKRFGAVYDRVMSCASDKHVVVLTHTQIEDWTTDAPNKGWVYVNGHTHRNGLAKDG